jgi:hypothetical protein
VPSELYSYGTWCEVYSAFWSSATVSAATSSASRPQAVPASVCTGVRCLLCFAVSFIVVITAVRAGFWWRNDVGISFASGAILTMAADLRDGIFYRPLLDASGYGGTRYFPLYFCLHALLLKAGLPVLLSAYLLSTAILVFLMLGTFRLLRELGVETWLAGCSALMLLASSSVQLSLFMPQADGLAAALNVWGLATIVPAPRTRGRLLLTAILFTLAWSATLTTVFGLAAATVWLVSTGHKRTAWKLAAATFCGYGIVAAATVLASRGRVIQIFKACASGGMDWRFLGTALGRMKATIIHGDPGLAWFLMLGLLLTILTRPSKIVRSLPALVLLAAVAVAVIIFGSPGTAVNHFLDVQVAAVILLATWVGTNDSPIEKQLGVCALALLTLIAAIPLLHHIKSWGRTYHPHHFQQVIQAIGSSNKPILSENAIIPVLAGQHPYVLDPWMTTLLRKRFPAFELPLLQQLRSQSFSAVVLPDGDPTTSGARWWYDNACFGPGFVSALTEHYRLATVVDEDWIYVPKTPAPAASGSQ